MKRPNGVSAIFFLLLCVFSSLLVLSHEGEGTVHDTENEAEHDRLHEDGHGSHKEEEGDDHESDHDHEEKSSPEPIVLSHAEEEKFAIEVQTAGPGPVRGRIQVPCEITFNNNRFAHVVPAVSGVLQVVLKNLGDPVEEGEVMAWIESSALGKAKVAYLSRLSESLCGKVQLERSKDVHDATSGLLELLRTLPPVERLGEIETSGMGTYGGRLVSSYVSFQYEKNRYLREKELLREKSTSRDSFLKAEREWKTAEAEFHGVVDSVAYEIRHQLQDAEHSQQVREVGLMAAERQLCVFGLSNGDIASLKTFASRRIFSPDHTEEHQMRGKEDFPSGKENQSGGASEGEDRAAYERLAWYPVRAPFSGTVVEKHGAPGEIFSEYKQLYTVSDLRTVWAELHIRQKDITQVRRGGKAAIVTENGLRAEGTVSYIDRTVDRITRTVSARVVLDNDGNWLRPGMYADAFLDVGGRAARLVLPKEAVQYMEDRPCVFVETEQGFVLNYVTPGRSSGRVIEILDGLHAGDVVVTRNAFRLKAELKRRRSGDAGHGHSH